MGSVRSWVTLVLFPAAVFAVTEMQAGQSKAEPPKPPAQAMPKGKASVPPAVPPKDDSAEKRRERMKARDAEMDRVLKQKQNQSKGR